MCESSQFLASYFHICLKSIYRKLTVKYAKLARSQISATVSGYNCGNANVLRVAAGDFSWSAALFPACIACMSLRFVCLLDLRSGKDFMCLSRAEGRGLGIREWVFQGGFPRGR